MSDAEAIADLDARVLVVERAIEVLFADIYRDRPDRVSERLVMLKGELAKASRSDLASAVDDHAKLLAKRIKDREAWDPAEGT